MLSMLLSALVSVAAAALVNVSLTPVARALVRWATAGLPLLHQDRYREEWQGVLAECHGGLESTLVAGGLVLATLRIRASLRYELREEIGRRQASQTAPSRRAARGVLCSEILLVEGDMQDIWSTWRETEKTLDGQSHRGMWNDVRLFLREDATKAKRLHSELAVLCPFRYRLDRLTLECRGRLQGAAETSGPGGWGPRLGPVFSPPSRRRARPQKRKTARRIT